MFICVGVIKFMAGGKATNTFPMYTLALHTLTHTVFNTPQYALVSFQFFPCLPCLLMVLGVEFQSKYYKQLSIVRFILALQQ